MRPGAIGLSVVILMSAAGCATKKDVDRIRTELAVLRARQDSLVAGINGLQRSVQEAMDEQQQLAVATRGDLRRQLDDMERQLVQIQELLGQSQIALRGLRERTESREWGVTPPAGAEPSPADSGRTAAPEAAGGEPGGDARALYAAAIEQFRRGAFGTARSGFQEFLVEYPADDLAPDAQYYLAETFREEGDVGRAIREYNRVVELYPNSQTAPTALYKAGLLHEEQGNRDTACQYFQRVLAGYPRSDEARLARNQAERLSCR